MVSRIVKRTLKREGLKIKSIKGLNGKRLFTVSGDYVGVVSEGLFGKKGLYGLEFNLEEGELSV